MTNYSFYDCFSPVDFEKFAQDVLQVREGVEFKLSKRGKDGGIDFYHQNEEQFIIGQAKRYANFKDLLRVLKQNELARVVEKSPSRYILVTSLYLSNSQVRKILDVFKGYIISEKDILGKHELNELLNDISGKYAAVERKHHKLWMSGVNMLSEVLDGIVYRRLHNLAKIEIQKIDVVSKLYVQNLSFDEAEYILNCYNYVIISGSAGSGKTTLARVLALSAIREGYELVVISRSVREALDVMDFNRKQVFLYDDFLGSYQFDEGKASNTELVELHRFTEIVEKSENCKLLLTTREYILQRGQHVHRDQLNKRRVDLKKCIVDVSKYTRIERAEILFNHLYFSEVNRSFMSLLSTQELFNEIIDHSNYSPRLIEDFVFRFIPENQESHKDDYRTFHALKEYLNDPFVYWKKVFERQSKASMLMLLTLFSAGDRMFISDLKRAFQQTTKAYKHQFDDLELTPETFELSLKELLDSFITTEPLEYWGDIVSFQNPSINDFLLEYLSSRDNYIDTLIEGITFWNQYNHVFITSHKRFLEGEYRRKVDISSRIFMRKISLSKEQEQKMLNVILNKFNFLVYSYLEDDQSGDLEDTGTFKHEKRAIELDQLYQLTLSYDIKTDENAKLRSLILQKVKVIIDNKVEGVYQIHFRALHDLPRLLLVCKDYIKLSPLETIVTYRRSIQDSLCYYSFQTFGDLFPAEYEEYYQDNIKSIRKDIRQQILTDLDYYVYDDFVYNSEADLLYDIHAEGIFEDYGMRMTKSFKRKMKIAMSGFEDDYAITSIREIRGEVELKLKREEETRAREDERIRTLFGGIRIGVIDELSAFKRKKIESTVEYYERVLTSCYSNSKEFIKLKIDQLAFESVKEERTEFSFRFLHSFFGLETEEDTKHVLGEINPLLIEKNDRYYFGNSELQNYLFLKKVLSLPDEQRSHFLNKACYKDWFGIEPQRWLSLWEELDPVSLFSGVIAPKWNDTIKALDFEDNASFLLSYCSYFNFDFSIGINKDYSGLESQLIPDYILSELSIHLGVLDIVSLPPLFFESDFYENDFLNTTRFGNNCYKTFIQYMKNNCQTGKSILGLEDDETIIYDIPFSQLVLNDSNFRDLILEWKLVDYFKDQVLIMDNAVKKLKGKLIS